MNVEFTTSMAEIEIEIEMLRSMQENVMRGLLEVGRDDENRLVFRMTAEGKAYVESMVH